MDKDVMDKDVMDKDMMDKDVTSWTCWTLLKWISEWSSGSRGHVSDWAPCDMTAPRLAHTAMSRLGDHTH